MVTAPQKQAVRLNLQYARERLEWRRENLLAEIKVLDRDIEALSAASAMLDREVVVR